MVTVVKTEDNPTHLVKPRRRAIYPSIKKQELKTTQVVSQWENTVWFMMTDIPLRSEKCCQTLEKFGLPCGQWKTASVEILIMHYRIIPFYLKQKTPLLKTKIKITRERWILVKLKHSAVPESKIQTLIPNCAESTVLTWNNQEKTPTNDAAAHAGGERLTK